MFILKLLIFFTLTTSIISCSFSNKINSALHKKHTPEIVNYNKISTVETLNGVVEIFGNWDYFDFIDYRNQYYLRNKDNKILCVEKNHKSYFGISDSVRDEISILTLSLIFIPSMINDVYNKEKIEDNSIFHYHIYKTNMTSGPTFSEIFIIGVKEDYIYRFKTSFNNKNEEEVIELLKKLYLKNI